MRTGRRYPENLTMTEIDPAFSAPDFEPGSTLTAQTAAPVSRSASGAGAVVALILCGALFCTLSVATERGFYYWDFAAYQNQTLDAADQAGRLFAKGGSFSAPLFTVPLIPWVLLLGDSRLVFVLAVYFTFFVPYLLLAAVIAKRVLPEPSHDVAIVTAAAALLTSAAWSHVLQGYPDIAGAALMVACVLSYGRAKPGIGLLMSVRIGVLAGLSIVLRRHYVYAVAALYAGMFLDAIACSLILRGRTPVRFPLVRHGFFIAVSGVASLGMIALVTPGFFAMAMNTTRGEMAPYEQSVAATLVSMVATVGAVPLLLSALGWVWIGRRAAPWPSELRLVFLATAAWVIIWGVQARQQPYHYPHWLPLFVILGLVWLWSSLANGTAARWRTSARLSIASLLIVGWVLSMPLLAASMPDATPLRMFPDRMRRSSNPAYGAITDLVHTLRAVTRSGEPILVAASSLVLNVDIVRSAEVAIYGRENARLNILNSPQTDSEPLPTDMLLGAQVVVVAEPFQHHLAAEHQEVVSVLVEAFRGGWPVSQDFELVPSAFPLPEPGGQIRVYRRHRPSSLEVAADTTSRIEAFVLGRATGGAIWLVRSEFPSQSVRDADGTVRVNAHPSRASTRKPTRIALFGDSPQAGEISAMVSFFDARCAGIEVVALAGSGEKPEEVPLGIFAPGAGDAPLRGSLPRLGGRPLALEIRSAPAHPENIDFCTVGLRSLKLSPAPQNPPPVR